jgi:alcohol dehydrogenase YqhD (iron-dependent ADH family)
MTKEDPLTPVQDRLMEGLIHTAMEACIDCLDNPTDYRARADLMWTATLALNGLTAAGLGKVGFPMHMIEHSLSAMYDVPHGAGLAVVIPGWLSWRAEKDPDRIEQLGRGILDLLSCENKTEAVEKTITILRNWLQGVDCPTSLTELGIPAGDIPAIAENALALAKVWRLTEYDQTTIEDILRRCR